MSQVRRSVAGVSDDVHHLNMDDLNAAWDAGEAFLASLDATSVTLACAACGEPQWAGPAGPDTEFASDASPRMTPGERPSMTCVDCGAVAPPAVIAD